LKRTVLIVDDEIDVLNSLRRQLRKEPFTTIFVSSGKEALKILEKQTVHVLLADHRMPSITGCELLQRVKKQYPDIVRIIFSGFIDMYVLINSINKGEVYRFITKPWDAQEFKKLLYTSIEHYDVLEANRRCMQEILAHNKRLTKTAGDRERTIELTDSVLDALPFAVLALDRSMKIIKMNSLAKSVFPSEGEDISGKQFSSFVSGELIDFIVQGLEKNDGQDARRFTIGDKKFMVRVRKLREDVDMAKGLIIIDE